MSWEIVRQGEMSGGICPRGKCPGGEMSYTPQSADNVAFPVDLSFLTGAENRDASLSSPDGASFIRGRRK